MTKQLDGIVVSDFVTILLGNQEWQNCPTYIAEKLQIADHDEQYVFVELPNSLNGLNRAKVWNIRDWKQSYERLTKRRQLSELENRVHTIQSDCRNRVLLYLTRLTGLESSDMLESANKIVKRRCIPEMLTMLVRQNQIDDLLGADRELADFKKKIGLK